MKSSIICFIILFISCNSSVEKPLSIKDVKSISIRDQMNWNYERVYSLNWEIKFTDSIELWHTKQISWKEFQVTFNKSKVDSLNLWVMKERKLQPNRFKDIWAKRNIILENDYQLYCDTVKSVFVKYINENEIVRLSNALLDTSYTSEKFISEIEPADSILENLELLSSSYYPFIGVIVTLNSEDSLIAYCNDSGLLTMPWQLKHSNFKSYNPEINRALYAILPEEMNFNRNRLTTGFSKPN